MFIRCNKNLIESRKCLYEQKAFYKIKNCFYSCFISEMLVLGSKMTHFPQLGHNINLPYEPTTATFFNPCQKYTISKKCEGQIMKRVRN